MGTKRCNDCAYFHQHSARKKTLMDKLLLRDEGTGEVFYYRNGECHAHSEGIINGPGFIKRVWLDRDHTDPACTKFVPKDPEPEQHECPNRGDKKE